jgi:O-acetylserine/cysteine efflux transporter
MPNTPQAFSPRDIAFALFIVVSWGLNFVVMKWGLRDWTPFQMGFARYLLAAFPMVLLISPRGLPMRWVLLYGLMQGVGQFGLLFTALKFGMTASLASVLMQTQVYFTALIGLLVLGERLQRMQWVGLALAALGLICFAMHFVAKSPDSTGAITTFSFVLTLSGAAAWAVSNIVARQAQRSHAGYDPLAFVVWSALIPILPFALLSSLLDAPGSWAQFAAAPWQAWAVAAYLGWVATIMGYAMWTTLLKRHAANKVAPLSLGVPVVGIAAGLLILGETIGRWQWAGIVFVAAALVATLLGERVLQGLQRPPSKIS